MGLPGIRRLACMIGAGFGLGLVMPVHAQEQTASGASLLLEEVIVTARRVEENIQEVPISITTFNQARLTDLNVINAVDLALVTPSLSANPSLGTENSNLAIRGFNQVLDTQPSVATYFADVVVPRGPTQGIGVRDAILPGSMFDLQNVQVLKGPQGTLFGRNTTGGAVLLVPQKPTDQFAGYVEGSVGNYDMTRIQGMLNVPLGDRARFRIAGDQQKRDGYLENIAEGGSDYEDVDYWALRASLVVDFTDTLENYTIASVYNSDSHGTMSKLIGCDATGYGDSPDFAAALTNFIGGLSCGQLAAEEEQGADYHDVASPVVGIAKLEQWQLINTTTWNLSDSTLLKGILSYSEYQNTQRTPLFGTNWSTDTALDPLPAVFPLGVPSIFTGINPAPGRFTADQSTYTAELQIQGGAMEERLSYQAGVYYEGSDPESTVANQSPTLIVCDDVATFDCMDTLGISFTGLAGSPQQVGTVGLGLSETEYRNRALYAQATYTLNEQWRLTGGLRYTWDKQQSDISHRTTSFPVTPPFDADPMVRCTDVATEPSCGQSLEQKSDEPTWLLGVDYFATEEIMLYGKYARGYRAGGIVNRAPFDYRTFEPEELDNFEIGLKSSFYGRVSGTFNVALFYNELTNQQIQVGFSARTSTTGVAPTTGIANAGESEMYGAEIEASLVPVENLVLNLSYTWLKAEIKEIEDIVTEDPLFVADTLEIESGSPIWQTPEHQLTLSANYTLPFDDRLGRVSLGMTYVYMDEQLTTYLYQDPEIVEKLGEDFGTLPSIDLLNANINWEDVAGLPLDLSLFATNVTDEEYYVYVQGLGHLGLETAVLGQPRMYGLRLRYRFGDN